MVHTPTPPPTRRSSGATVSRLSLLQTSAALRRVGLKLRIPSRAGSAVFFRRLTPQITNPGGLWDESQNFYPRLGGIRAAPACSASIRGNAEPDRLRLFTPRDESTGRVRDMVEARLQANGRGARPAALVRNTVRAEQAGSRLRGDSDHFFPWLDEQGHAPFAWSVLGAVANATRQIAA